MASRLSCTCECLHHQSTTRDQLKYQILSLLAAELVLVAELLAELVSSIVANNLSCYCTCLCCLCSVWS